MDRLLEAKDLDRWSELNLEFHRAVASLTEMKLLIEFLNRALDSWMRLRRWYLQRILVQLPQSQAEHHEMVELLSQHDIPNLTRVIIQHNRRMREYYQQAVMDRSRNSA
jgi:DNA-binding GntR family transcriptional regulator